MAEPVDSPRVLTFIQYNGRACLLCCVGASQDFNTINSLLQKLQSSAYKPAPNTNDDNSISTNDTHGSITAAVNVLRQHSSRYSSGRNPDFRCIPR